MNMTTENTIRDKANTTNTHNPGLTPAENNPDQFKVNAGNEMTGIENINQNCTCIKEKENC